MISRAMILGVAAMLSVAAFFLRRREEPPSMTVEDPPSVSLIEPRRSERIFTQPATDIAVSGETVWATIDDGCIVGIEPDGTTRTIAHSEPVAHGIAADRDFVYWGIRTPEGGAIRRASVMGGDVMDVAVTDAPPDDLALHDGTIFFLVTTSGETRAYSSSNLKPPRLLAKLRGPPPFYKRSQIVGVDSAMILHARADRAIVRVDVETGKLATLMSWRSDIVAQAIAFDGLVYVALHDDRDRFERIFTVAMDGKSNSKEIRSGFDLGVLVAVGNGFFVMEHDWIGDRLGLALLPIGGGVAIDPGVSVSTGSGFVASNGLAYYTSNGVHRMRLGE